MIAQLRKTLQLLCDAQVEFVLVGGLSAVVRGAPVNTYDLDIVHKRDPQNIDRILPVLESLDAVFRIQPARRLRPNQSHLAGRGHVNLTTINGLLDLSCTIGKDLTYEDILPHSDLMELSEGLIVRVLRLEQLIVFKEEIHSDKDRAVLPILRATLDEIRKAESGRYHAFCATF